jgi:hypothetical protein
MGNMSTAAEIEKPTNHIIGSARTIRTAVMCVEYLRARKLSECYPPNAIKYRFQDPTPANGQWSAEIYVEMYGYLPLNVSSSLVDLCRAFVAGAKWDDSSPHPNPALESARMWTAWEPDPSDKFLGMNRGRLRRNETDGHLWRPGFPRRWKTAEAAIKAVDREYPLQRKAN